MKANEKYFLKLSKKVSIDRIPEKNDAVNTADGGIGFFYDENGKRECFITAYNFTAEKDSDVIFITEEDMRGVYCESELFFAITDRHGRVLFSNTGREIPVNIKRSLKAGDELYMVSVCEGQRGSGMQFDFELLMTDRNGNTEEAFITEANLLKNQNWSSIPADRADLFVDYSDKVKNNELNAADCSFADGSGHINNYVFKALMLTASLSKARLVLPLGTYYLSADEESPCGIDMSHYKLDGLSLDGKGSTILMTDNFKGGFSFIGSKNMLLENLVLDYVNVPWAQGTIVEANAEEQTVRLLLDDDYNIFDDERFHESISAHYGTVRDRDNPRFLDPDALYYFFMKSVEKKEERLYEIKLHEATPLVGYTMELDDKLVINNRVGCNMSMFDIRESGNFTLRNITVYSCACTGIVGSQMTGPVFVDNFVVTYRPDSKLWISATADGVHIQAGLGAVTIENSNFIGLIDDGVNLYQWRSLTDKILADNRVRVYNDGGCMPRENDTLEFYDSVNMKFLGAAKAVKIENTAGSGPHSYADVTLDKNICGIKEAEGENPATYIYIQEQDMKGSVIRNCTFSNLRGRGVVLHSEDTLVENNRFVNISNHGVHGWYGYEEGLRLRGLTVRNNYFSRVGYYRIEANQLPCGVISVRLDNNAATEQSEYLFHENIVIEDNIIADFHGAAISIGNSEKVVVKGNKIISDVTTERYGKERGIHLSHCTDVKVSDNLLDNTLADVWTPFTLENCEDVEAANNVYFAQGIKKLL